MEREKPRVLNLTLSDKKQPWIEIDGQNFLLRNLSENGIGVWAPRLPSSQVQQGQRLVGFVGVDRKRFSCILEVRHITEGLIGLEFIEIPEELRLTLKGILQPTLMGASLIEHPNSRKDDGTGHLLFWLTGEYKTELLLTIDPFQRRIIKLQLCWRGNWVYRKEFEKPKTGNLASPSQAQGLYLDTSQLLVAHPSVDTQLLREATQVLTSCPKPFPGYLLWQFLEIGEQVYLPEGLLNKEDVA